MRITYYYKTNCIPAMLTNMNCYQEFYQDDLRKNHLKIIRKTRGLRQLDVACKLGFCTTDRVSLWEKGQSMPNLVNLFRLCHIYKVHPFELYPSLFEKITQETELIC